MVRQLLWPFRFRRWMMAWGALLAGAVCRGALAGYDLWLDLPVWSVVYPIAASASLFAGFYWLATIFVEGGALTAPGVAAFVEIDSLSQIVVWDTQAERLFGWLATEAIGQTLMQTIIPPRDWEAHRAGLARLLATGDAGRAMQRMFAVNAYTKSGEEIAIVAQITAVPHADGTLHFVGRIHELGVL